MTILFLLFPWSLIKHLNLTWKFLKATFLGCYLQWTQSLAWRYSFLCSLQLIIPFSKLFQNFLRLLYLVFLCSLWLNIYCSPQKRDSFCCFAWLWHHLGIIFHLFSWLLYKNGKPGQFALKFAKATFLGCIIHFQQSFGHTLSFFLWLFINTTSLLWILLMLLHFDVSFIINNHLATLFLEVSSALYYFVQHTLDFAKAALLGCLIHYQ